MSVTLLIVLLLIIANLPWMSNRVFMVLALKSPKSVVIRLAEQLVYYLMGLLIAIGFEMRFSGEIYPQTWEFFVTTFCLFLVLAVPGMIYRYQWLPMQQKLR